eukprot:gene16675-11933_t
MSAPNSSSPPSVATSVVPDQDRISSSATATNVVAAASDVKDTVANELLQICRASRNSRPTKFAAFDWLLHERACPLTSIRVAGIDRDIPIPISKEDIALLKDQAERAPFGFGPQTLMDQTVRDAWQVDGRNVWSESQPSFFQRTVQTMILTSLKEQLGLDTYSMDVHATLYKMLLYEEGGHFLPHRDTEKEPGMFGTYLLQIPVEDGHEGGQLCVRHLGQEVAIDTSSQSTSAAFQEAMFYADCEHELKEVTRGRRCVLAFNLCWRASGKSTGEASDEMVGRKRKLSMSLIAGLPSSHVAVLPQLVERVTALVGRWTDGDDGPDWVSVPLDHKYTVENLSFDHLKGKDALMARPFMAVPFSKLAMYLVLERITFGTDFDSSEPNPRYDKKNSKEDMKGMAKLVLSMVSREEKTLLTASEKWYGYGYGEKVSSAYKLHEVLNRLGNELVLDATKLDSFKDGCEYTGNESQPEERTYFRCLLLLTPKCFESTMLDAINCVESEDVPKAVDNAWSDSDSSKDEDDKV